VDWDWEGCEGFPGQMKNLAPSISALPLIIAVCLTSLMFAQGQSRPGNSQEAGVAHQAKGSFDVKITPADNPSPESPLGRMILDKQYHGDFEGTGRGQMLTAGTGAKGSSGAYVALERVTGNLQGRSGSFTLQHRGIMTKGVPQLTIEVVPDSGTDQLAGISGTMNVIIAPDGKHSYEFNYMLAPGP
jgi:Protein of unknown function (DUF3224)